MAGRQSRSRGLTVAVTGPTGEIGQAFVASLERARDVARVLLEAPEPPRDAAAVAELVVAAGHEAELEAARGGWALDIIQSA